MLIIIAFWGYLKHFDVRTILWCGCGNDIPCTIFSKKHAKLQDWPNGTRNHQFYKNTLKLWKEKTTRFFFFTSNCHCWILPINLLTSRLKTPALRCPSLIVGFLKTMNTYARILGGLIFFHEEKMFKCHAKSFFFFEKPTRD